MTQGDDRDDRHKRDRANAANAADSAERAPENAVRPAIWGAAFFLLLLLSYGLWLAAGPGAQAPASEAAAKALHVELAALQAEVAAERQALRLLASEVELMRQVMLEFSEELGLAESDGEVSESELSLAASPEADDPSPDGADEADEAGTAAVDAQPSSEKPIFDLDQVIAAGVDEREAERVRDLWYQAELDKLELRDIATREGWVKAKRFKKQLDRIRRDTLDDLGECGYDSLLYGTGKNNRVVVRDVLDGSTAARAGLQPGDIVMRYNDRRVWAGSDLQQETARGNKGETIVVDVERNGEMIYLNLERGPIGMFMRQTRVAPSGC